MTRRYELWSPPDGKTHAVTITASPQVACGAGGYITPGKDWVYMGSFPTRQEAAEQTTCPNCKTALTPKDATQ